MKDAEVREKLATIEHERWADWQRYMHSVAIDHGGQMTGGELILPAWAVENWTRQINTKYADLTDKEKASDMEQVDRYWPLIQELVTAARKEGEMYGRANEHHIISAMLSNDELGKLLPATVRRLKARQKELSEAHHDTIKP